MKEWKLLSILCFWLLGVLFVSAQPTRVCDPEIKSISMILDGVACDFPVITLDGDKVIEVSFDDLRHDYRSFYYHIEHVSANFEESEGIFVSDYVRTSDDKLPVLQYEQSMSTTVLYNHYSFCFPNDELRPLLSGNYRLVVTVEDEDGNEVDAFETYFAVSEQSMPINAKATTNTEIDHNDKHQQLDIEVETGAFNLHRPNEEVLIRVQQNGRWIDEVFALPPTSQNGTKLLWQHSKSLIFPAGNEFRRFEQMSVRYPGMKVDRVAYNAPYYYAFLMNDGQRRNYIYDEDQNGAWVVRSEYEGNVDVEADYMYTVFTLDMPYLENVDIYIDGVWTGHQLTPEYRMEYNHSKRQYEAILFLKQGYYSYQYLTIPKNSSEKNTSFTSVVEGDFFQTENRYDIYVYLRERGARYDRLVGWRRGNVNKK